MDDAHANATLTVPTQVVEANVLLLSAASPRKLTVALVMPTQVPPLPAA